MDDNFDKILIAIFGAVLVFGVAISTPIGLKKWNQYKYEMQKIDDATNYHTLKEVEDSCRAMITSYESDKMMYLQYKDSESAEQKSWSDNAKIRANKTASSYNNYILKNSFVWKDNVPSDIKESLEYLE